MLSEPEQLSIDLPRRRLIPWRSKFVERILKMSQTLRKISEKKLIKEVETNFKLVGILLAIAAPGRAVQGRRGPDPCPRDGESFILMGKVGIFHQNLTRFCGNSPSLLLLMWGAGLGHRSSIIIQFSSKLSASLISSFCKYGGGLWRPESPSYLTLIPVFSFDLDHKIYRLLNVYQNSRVSKSAKLISIRLQNTKHIYHFKVLKGKRFSKLVYFMLCVHPIVMGLSIMYISILNWQFFPYFSRKWLNFHIRFVMPNVSVTNRMFKDIYCF